MHVSRSRPQWGDQGHELINGTRAMKYFIAGTDTDVGKTVASTWAMLQLDATYWKPIQAGLEDETDEEAVKRLTGASADRFLPSAYRLPEPLSPHESAKRAGITIENDRLAVPDHTGPLIVEGAGGLMVPLNTDTLIIDLIAQLGLPVMLVCRSTLGTINHTLLSLEALRRRDITIAGAVLNGPPSPHNREAIESYGKIPIIAELPQLDPLTGEALLRIKPEIDL